MNPTQPTGTRDAFEYQVLSSLFDGFAAIGVRHAVLRGYETLPYTIHTRDIDIFILPDDLLKASSVIIKVTSHYGCLFANHYQDERLTQFTLVRRLGPDVLVDIKIDFFTSSQVFGIELLPAREMLRNLRWHNGIPVVSESVQLLDKWLFHLAVGQPLHPKYDTRFGQIARQARPYLLETLAPLLGEDEAGRLLAAIEADGGSNIEPLTARARRRLIARMWSRQEGFGLSLMARFIMERLRNRLRPHGTFLSVSGPDGSGKTTVIELVLAQLRQIYGADAVEYHHFRPTVLPRIAEVAKAAGAVEKVDVDYARPHRSAPSGLFGSLARLAWYGLDYFGGYFRMIRPALVDRKVVLYDRYYYDMICDPGRSRVRLPAAILRAVGRLLPLPAFAFFIRVAPEIAHARKQELTQEQIRTLNLRYDDLARRGWLIAVDNDGAPEQAAAAIVDHIIVQKDEAARRALKIARE